MSRGFIHTPYLCKRGSLFHFRWTFSQAICNLIGKREMRIALGTGYKKVAVQRAIRLAASLQGFTARVQREATMQTLTPDYVQSLLRHYRDSALAEREHWRSQSEPLSDQDIENELIAFRYLQRDTQEQLKHHDYSRVAPGVDQLLAEAGTPSAPLPEPLRRQLSRGMLRIDAEMLGIEIRRTQGDYSQDFTAPQPPVLHASPQPAKKISDAFAEYVSERIKGERWTEKTRLETEAMCRDMCEIIGDRAISLVGKEEMRTYKQVLMRLPPNRRKRSAYRDKSIAEIMAMPDIPQTLSVKTINDILGAMSSFFAWAVNQGYLTANPATGLRLAETRRADEQRAEFSTEQLRTMFLGEEYRARRSGGHDRMPYQFWLPLLGLFTGARIEELASLRIFDIVSVEEIPMLDINTHEGKKRLKTANARRRIALHPELIALGFLDYVEAQKQRGYMDLFPELGVRRGRKGITASRWFARFLDRHGMTERELVFHSFRHTWINALKQAGVEKSLVQEMAGHDSGDGQGASVTFGRYGKQLRPAVQRQYLSQIQFDIDWSQLHGIWPTLMRPQR